MASNQAILLFLIYMIVHVTGLTFEEAPDFLQCLCVANYTADILYIKNRDTALSSISSKLVTTGFFNFSVGHNPNTVNVIALCDGDIDSDTCHSCLNNSTTKLKGNCLNSKEAVGWYENCMLRYSNDSIFHTYQSHSTLASWTINNNTLKIHFNSTIKRFIQLLIPEAATASSKFINSTTSFVDDTMIYGMVQCTPDLPKDQCSHCLDDVLEFMYEEFGKGASWGATPSCKIKLDTRLINKETGTAPPSSDNTLVGQLPLEHTKGKKTWKTAVTISASLVGALLLGFCYICYCRRIREARDKNFKDVQLLDLAGEILGDEQDLPLIPLDVICTATQHFSKENKLGEGGFGPVYKGTLVDGKEIAVKRLSRNSGQGLQEFKAEVTLIARLQHRNLVKLFGCCMEGNELILVYDYMPKGSLDAVLFDSTRGAELDWQTRYRIIKGIARGLLYLHEDSRLEIIHRDLKSSNILLDDEINPRISDFGMARIFGSNQSEANTKRVMGTFGYMAPEYTTHGLFSDKSDVFSFGVLLLEIISGKKTSQFHLSGHGPSLPTFVWKLWCNGQGMELMDPVLMQTYVEKDVLKCIHIGLLCVQEDPANRPTMSSVVFMLERHTMSLPQPTEPAFFYERNDPSAAGQLIPNYAGSSINEISFSALSPR